MSKLLAIDVGTSGTKVGVFDADGSVCQIAYRPTPLKTPQRDWVEQDPDLWWDSVLSILQEVPETDKQDLKAVTVVGQNPTLVSIDRRGGLVRPAISWADRRSLSEAEALSKRLDKTIDVSSNLAKMKWLQLHEPHAFAQTDKFLQCIDFLNFRLTGEATTVCPVPPWPPFSAADLEGAGIAQDLVPERVAVAGELLGAISSSSAQATGLPEGLEVVAGLVDGVSTCIGTGTLDQGDLYFGSGTTSGVNLCWPTPLDSQGRLWCFDHPLDCGFLIGGPMSTGSRFLDWFAQSVCRQSTEELSGAVAESSTTSEAPIVALPYLLGERIPLNDPLARACFVGLTEGHTHLDMGRAVMESVAFAIRDVTEILLDSGLEISVLKSGGGGTKSAHWNQIKCDVLGTPLVVPKVKDSGLLGAAIIAGWGGSLFTTGREAAQSMTQVGETYEPDTKRHEHYTGLFVLYQSLYRHLKNDFLSLSKLAVANEEEG